MQETQEIQVWSLGWEDPLEKGMATHSSILAWRIPWTEEPDGLQFTEMQSQTQLNIWSVTTFISEYMHSEKMIYSQDFQWSSSFRIHAPNTRGWGSVPGQGTGFHKPK